MLGRAQAKLGRFEEARESLHKAVSTVTLEDAKVGALPAHSGDKREQETDDEATSVLMAAFKFSHAVGCVAAAAAFMPVISSFDFLAMARLNILEALKYSS